jgi:hypothetical protein
VTERSRLPAFSTTSDGHVAATPARQPAAAAAGPMLSRASPTSDEVLDLDSALADLDPLELPDLEPLHV